MEYRPLLIPALVLAGIAARRPLPRTALVLSFAIALLMLPAGLLLADAGGIECPRGCSAGHDLLQGLFFVGIPLSALVPLGGRLLQRCVPAAPDPPLIRATSAGAPPR